MTDDQRHFLNSETEKLVFLATDVSGTVLEHEDMPHLYEAVMEKVAQAMEHIKAAYVLVWGEDIATAQREAVPGVSAGDVPPDLN